jgi:predicted DNA-binding transcriptional regulator AlpA
MKRKNQTANPKRTTTPNSKAAKEFVSAPTEPEVPRAAGIAVAPLVSGWSVEIQMDKSRLRCMLSEKQVLEIVPVGRTTLYRMEKAGRFPKSTYISPNRRVWFEDEIIAWQNAVDEFDPKRRRGKGRARA